MTAGEPAPPIPARAYAVLSVCSATAVLVLLDSGMLAVAFPSLEEHFADQAARTTLSWIFTLFFVVMVSAMLVAGRVADRYGRRPTFLAGLIMFGVAALVSASTNDVAVLITARAFQGLGVALLAPSALALALPAFPEQRRAFALGVWGTIAGTAGLTASPIAAVVVQAFGWRGVFVANGLFALALAVVGAFILRENASEHDGGAIDIISAALVMVSVSGLALVLVQGRDWGWTARPTALAAAACVAAGALFVSRNKRQSPPLVDPAIFTNRRFVVASVASVASQLGFFSAYIGIPLYMSEVWDWSPLRIGLGILPLNAVGVVTAVAAGRIVDRHGPRSMIAFGGAFAAIWYVAMGLWLTEAGYVWLAIAMGCAGLGAVAIGNHTTIAALRDIPDDQLGAANASYFMTRRLGSALGAVAVAMIVGNRSGGDFADVYLWVWVFGGAAYLGGALVVWFFYPPWRLDT